MQSIVEAFCQHHGVAQEDIITYERSQKHYFTRYMVWHYLHCSKGMSAGKLSKLFNRNVPSIFRGIRLLKHQFKYDKSLLEEYYAIVSKIEGETKATPSVDME